MRTRNRPLLRSLAVLLLAAPAALAGERAWRHDTREAFADATRDGVVLAESGHVRLAQEIDATADLDAARVWAIAHAMDGAVFAATGDDGRVFRREGDGPWQLAYDSDDTQALSLAAMPDGRVFVGTGPGGQVVELTDPAHPSGRPGPGVEYVWALAPAPDGSLLAATGPAGQLWRRPAGWGDWVLVLDSPRRHLLSLAVGRNGAVFAGSDGEGLVYRVGADGRVAVVLDAPESDVRVLAAGPDGSIYAGTADGEDEGGRRASAPGRADSPPVRPASNRPVRLAQDRPRPRPGGSGGNTVYRIDPDGASRAIFKTSSRVDSLLFRANRLLVGTGPEGRLYEVRGDGREAVDLTRVDHGQLLSLLAVEGDAVLLGVGDPGGVVRLRPGLLAEGTLTSDVLDAGLPSRFGALTWRAETPEGTRLSVQARSGNVGEPDETWSAPRSGPDAAADIPPGRFAQYCFRFETGTLPARRPSARSRSTTARSTSPPRSGSSPSPTSPRPTPRRRGRSSN
jgi:outer membrane protein assembly factor BamB